MAKSEKEVIILNEQLQKFWLATEGGWIDAAGHAIYIGHIHLCVIAYDNKINVSEVTSGMRVTEKELGFTDLMSLQDKESVMAYYKKIALELSERFSAIPSIKQRIEEKRKITENQFGPAPSIENLNEDELADQVKG